MQTFESLALLKVEIEKFELVHTEPANRLSRGGGRGGGGGGGRGKRACMHPIVLRVFCVQNLDVNNPPEINMAETDILINGHFETVVD